ncbi:MAG TPA: SHOCT domain-containing protein [Actinomycetota bacterium]|nr:SHOCT domain-containing protein [Actinomycetota bacterium]
MFWWWWGPDWGWAAGLASLAFWIVVIALVVHLLRRELPDLRQRMTRSPALELLEERYARGEISREEFLERRAVLLGWPTPTQGQSQGPPAPPPPPAPQGQVQGPPAPPPPPGPGPSPTEPTQPFPPPAR